MVEQLAMASRLDQPTLVEDQNRVRRQNRGKAVGDHDRGPTHHQLFQRVLYQGFGSRVEMRGRLVEDQHRRVLQDHPRNRQALPLAARQSVASLPHHREVSVR